MFSAPLGCSSWVQPMMTATLEDGDVKTESAYFSNFPLVGAFHVLGQWCLVCESVSKPLLVMVVGSTMLSWTPRATGSELRHPQGGHLPCSIRHLHPESWSIASASPRFDNVSEGGIEFATLLHAPLYACGRVPRREKRVAWWCWSVLGRMRPETTSDPTLINGS